MRSLSGKHGPRSDLPFRRTDFRERSTPLGHTQPSADPLPETRTLVFAKRNEVLPVLLQTACSISQHGADWHVRCRSREETERLLTILKLRKIRGIIKVPKGI